jgi:hypothetical protein
MNFVFQAFWDEIRSGPISIRRQWGKKTQCARPCRGQSEWSLGERYRPNRKVPSLIPAHAFDDVNSNANLRAVITSTAFATIDRPTCVVGCNTKLEGIYVDRETRTYREYNEFRETTHTWLLHYLASEKNSTVATGVNTLSTSGRFRLDSFLDKIPSLAVAAVVVVAAAFVSVDAVTSFPFWS